MGKLLLVLGVPGVGKSSIIKELLALDKRFVYIIPFTTRPSRGTGDTKISISNKAMDDLLSRGELLSVNEIHGIHCGTPHLPIVQALEQGKIPVLDWPINCMEVMKRVFGGQLYVVYVLPPSLEILQQRLMRDGRHTDEHRLQNAYQELEVYKSSIHAGICDLEIFSEEDKISQIAQAIYTGYLSSA